MEAMMFARYAIYAAPAPGDFAGAAARWLGRDAETGREVQQPVLPGLPRRLAEMTRAPRRYGFHGTLKAPFRLAAGVDRSALLAAVQGLASRLAPVVLPGLRLVRHGGFLALVPDAAEDAAAGSVALSALADLAARVVVDLDGLRAPLTGAEIARRNPQNLPPRERALLDRYGYPYVLDAFRFHMTLSDALDDATLAALLPQARAHFAGTLPRPFVIDALCLFGEDEAGRFHLSQRVALTG
jgi:putative phosphonate metabolism protein